MLQELAALERRCQREAPQLLDDVRRILETCAAPASHPESLGSTVLPDPVDLAGTMDLELPGRDPTAVAHVPTLGLPSVAVRRLLPSCGGVGCCRLDRCGDANERYAGRRQS